MRKLGRFFGIILIAILSVLLTISLVSILSRLINNKDMPKVLGFSNAIVISGSMAPDININDVVIIKDEDNYKVGDVVTYKDQKNVYVTHRIVEQSPTGFVTKGDANNTIDAKEVSLNQIQGKVVFSSRFLGSLIQWTHTPLGIALLLILAFLIIFFDDILKVLKKTKINIKVKEQNHQKTSYKRIFIALLTMNIIGIVLFLTFSKYSSTVECEDYANQASFILDGTGSAEAILNSSLEPGDSQKCTITIVNFKDIKTSDVAQQYEIVIECGENLPLTYSLAQKTTAPYDGTLISANNNIQLDTSTKKAILTGGDMPASETQITHEYTLTVSWPKEKKDYNYAGKSDPLKVTVNADQMDNYY